MKKAKFAQRVENAYAAFFEDNNFNEPNSLVFAGSREIAQTSAATQLSQTGDKYFALFKKIFLFLPGTLFLHFAVPASIVFGFGIWGVFWLAAGTFMVWAGTGDLKNRKHILLPFVVMLTALIFSIPFAFISIELANYYGYFYIGILPLLFIAPILVKNYLTEK